MRISRPHCAPPLHGTQAKSQSSLVYQTVRRATEALAAPLSEEDTVVQSMPDASPVKWHLAHTSWFFETFILEKEFAGYRPFHPSFRVLFNSYYNAIGDKHPRPQRGLISRPGLKEVRDYRRHIDEHMALLLSRGEGIRESVRELIELGCHHEQQHQELILTDLKHMLSMNPLKPVYREAWPLTNVAPRRMRWHGFDGGLVDIGFTPNGAFAFDNETPRHRVWLEPFELASHPVTYGEFTDFIADGGYSKPELWLSLGWDWVQANKIEAPLYWEERDSGWHTFTLHGMVPIDVNTPICHINYFEADAYARWANARLPMEAEWEIAASKAGMSGNFVESGALHPLAARSDNPTAPNQLYGDVWEWTQSAYLPYPGYQPLPGAVGEYNGKFMCNQFVLRGGSCASPQSHIRATYRNFFPPDARWQFSGLRLARDAQ